MYRSTSITMNNITNEQSNKLQAKMQFNFYHHDLMKMTMNYHDGTKIEKGRKLPDKWHQIYRT